VPANPIGVALRNRRAGHHTLVWARPDLQAPENVTLTSPALPDGFTLDQAIAAIAGHVIGRARLDGTYEIR
jgi:phosphatidylethanolamine-binding protein (PEBP) family uncharacterized protein